MCGRFTIAATKEELDEFISERYNLSSNNNFEVPNYNISPGSKIISVINDGKLYRIGLLHWGYLPDFPIKEKIGFINARAETLFDKPSFKKAAIHKRCIVIADGYYEWNKNKQPMRITTDEKIFVMAGIWNSTLESDGTKKHTVAIITTKANDIVAPIHDRMPVILNKEEERIWLTPNQDIEILKSILKPYEGKMDAYPVSLEINSAKNNYQDLINKIIETEII